MAHRLPDRLAQPAALEHGLRRAGEVDLARAVPLDADRAAGQLHVHHVVTNVLFVRGPVGAERGYLVVERDGGFEAMPLLGGDRAVVRPGLTHTVLPVEARDPIEMVVFNNDLSRYEDVEHSDFHLLGTVPWSEVTVRARADARPRLTIVP